MTALGGHIAHINLRGISPRQDFSADRPIGRRLVTYSCRVKRNELGPDVDFDFDGAWTYGDDHGWMVWRNTTRSSAAWGQGFPAIVHGTRRPRRRKTCGEMKPGAKPVRRTAVKRRRGTDDKLFPLLGPGEHDDRFEGKVVKNLRPTSWASKTPRGWTSIVRRDTEDDSEVVTSHQDFLGLMAVNWQGDPTYGTRVFDTNDRGEVDPKRWRELQSLVTVTDFASGPWFGGMALSLQLGSTRLENRHGDFTFIDDPNCTAGSASHHKGGPFVLAGRGGKGCIHDGGETADGHTVHPMHLHTDTLFLHNPVEAQNLDMPLQFFPEDYKKVEKDSGTWRRVYLRANLREMHTLRGIGTIHPGKWEWQVKVDTLQIKPPRLPPPKKPPRLPPPPPEDDPPEPQPFPPGVTGRRRPPRTPLPPPPTGQPPPHPPGSRQDPLILVGGNVPGVPGGGRRGRPITGGDPRDGFEGAFGGTGPEDDAAPVPDAFDAPIGETPHTVGSGHPRSYPHHTQCVSVPNILFSPVATNTGSADYSGDTAISAAGIDRIANAPKSGTFSAFAAGDGTWDGFTVAGVRGGWPVADGGVVFHPVDVTIAEIINASATPTSAVTAATIFPHDISQISFGQPTSAGGIKEGVTLRGADQDLGGIVEAHYVDATGVEAREFWIGEAVVGVQNKLALGASAAPGMGADGWGNLYHDTSDGKLYWHPFDGNAADLTGSPGVVVLSSDTVEVGNVGAGEDDLMTYTVGAGVVDTDGDMIRATCEGVYASPAVSATLKAYVNGTAILTNVRDTKAGNDAWTIDIRVVRDSASANTAKAYARYISDDADLPATGNCGADNALSITWANTFAIKLTGEDGSGTTNKIVQHVMLVEHVHA